MVAKAAAAGGGPGGVDVDGLVVRPVDEVGDLGPGTEVRLRQAGDLVWARYSGGRVRLGFLVGTTDGRTLHLRATHVRPDGSAATAAWAPRAIADDADRVALEGPWTGEGAEPLDLRVAEVPQG